MKIVTVVGARPQFVKAAVVSRALAAREGPVEVMIHTGQHYDDNMSAVFFRDLGIPPPKHHLGVGGGRPGEMTGRMLTHLEPVLLDERPDWVVIFGDTNSTLAGALAATKLHLRVAHVEAGLRSYNRQMPEEINRVVADHVSDVLLCPTSTAMTNLAREGLAERAELVGDVMFDAALDAQARVPSTSKVRLAVGIDQESYAVATVHRAENTASRERLSAIIEYLHAKSQRIPIVLVLHPRTRAAIDQWSIGLDGFLVSAPLGYLDMAALIGGAELVYTDSGGLQKEAYFCRVPCVTLRSETEWTETIAAGWNRLWTTPTYLPRDEISEYGDGRAGERVVDILLGGRQ